MRTSADRQRLTASIAILAVLLLFVAPMVSKNLAEHHASLQRLSAISGDMPMMDHHSDMPMAGHEMMAPSFACGYLRLTDSCAADVMGVYPVHLVDVSDLPGTTTARNGSTAAATLSAHPSSACAPAPGVNLTVF